MSNHNTKTGFDAWGGAPAGRRSRLASGAGLSVLAACLALLPASGQAQVRNSIAIGGSVNGALQQGDMTLSAGEYIDSYTFQGRAGQRIRVEMSSGAIDAYLLLTGPDGFQQENDDIATGNLNSRLEVTLPADGTYTIGATSAGPAEAGAYRLSLAGAGSGGQAAAPNRPAAGQGQAAAPSSGNGTLRPGQSVSGALAQGDGQLNSGEFTDTYTMQVTAGVPVELRLSSSQFDTYLMVRGPGDFSEDNDDDQGASGTTNSRLTVRPTQSGTMTVRVTSFEAGETGAYQLNVGGASSPANPGSQRPAARNNTNANATPGGTTQLAAGRPARGQLRTGDGQLNSGEFYDDFTLTARAGQSIVVDMTSTAFDTYLMVAGPEGFTQQNDDGPNGTNAQLAFTAPAAGTYMVRATSFRAGETGDYSVTVGGASTAANRPAPLAPQARTAAINLGQPQQGTLAQGDGVRQGGEFVDRYTLTGRPGERAAITLGGDFDTILTVVSPSGAREQNDDARAGTTDSYLEVEFAETGSYVVEVSSYQPNTSGRYQLVAQPLRAGQARSVQVSLPPQGAPPAPPIAGGSQIALGQSRSGSLARGDSTLSSGEFVDNYTFTGRRGENVRIDLSSSSFDTYLLVTPPAGEQIDNDDGPNGTNSQVDFTLPADGTYRIGVTSFAAGETGAYQLSVARSTAATANSSGGNAAAGRVYGVFAGISDYPGQGNDLDNTDKDARDLANAFRRSGLLAPESITLVDGQATRAAVADAVRRMASLAGPNDTVVVFYSGHGVQLSNTPGARSEPDGRDEALALYDGNLTDDEMGALLAGSRAGMSLLVLDACFSGGFARDVVTRPAVMGLFSSEEDLTSQVAGKFEAGGYLSHFIRLAFEGQADINANGSITAGELSTYLRSKFAEEGAITASTSDRQRNYQYLVVERGGVKIDDVVVALR